MIRRSIKYIITTILGLSSYFYSLYKNIFNKNKITKVSLDEAFFKYEKCSLSGKYSLILENCVGKNSWSQMPEDLEKGKFVKILGVSRVISNTLVVVSIKKDGYRPAVILEAKYMQVLDKEQEKIVKALYE